MSIEINFQNGDNIKEEMEILYVLCFAYYRFIYRNSSYGTSPGLSDRKYKTKSIPFPEYKRI